MYLLLVLVVVDGHDSHDGLVEGVHHSHDGLVEGVVLQSHDDAWCWYRLVVHHSHDALTFLAPIDLLALVVLKATLQAHFIALLSWIFEFVQPCTPPSKTFQKASTKGLPEAAE